MALNSAWARETGRSPNRRFQFHKSRQFFIRVRNETLPVIAMRVSNWQFTIKTNLKQSQEFEDNHDNDNYSYYVEDVSAHAGD